MVRSTTVGFIGAIAFSRTSASIAVVSLDLACLSKAIFLTLSAFLGGFGGTGGGGGGAGVSPMLTEGGGGGGGGSGGGGGAISFISIGGGGGGGGLVPFFCALSWPANKTNKIAK